MKFFQSRDIKDYGLVLDGLTDDFGLPFYRTMLEWCGVICGDAMDGRLWEVFLVEESGKNIAVCGLYSLDDGTDELWLGWFGVLPELRSKGMGAGILKFLEKKAKKYGCRRLLSYVDNDGKPLPFYYRNGFKMVSSVKDFIESKGLSAEQFEELDDFVISKEIK